MAKATATCTCKMCGKTFYKTVDGHNRSDANSRAKWAEDYYDLCEECYKKQQEEKKHEESKQMAEEQRNLGFADLEGQEWQIEKALRIRDKVIKDNYWEQIGKKGLCSFRADVQLNDAFAMVAAIIYFKSEKSASRLIAAGEHVHGSTMINTFMEKFKERIPNYEFLEGKMVGRVPDGLPTTTEPKQEEAPKPEPFTLEAEDAESVTCRLKAGFGKVVVETSGYSRTVTDVMHAEKYTWDRANYYWYRKMEDDRIEDGIAEIGAKLNEAHITCTYPSKEIAEKAINGTYAVENKRWIKANVKDDRYTGWLSIIHEQNNEIYQAAMQIKGATYRNYEIQVYERNFREIREFAAAYNFQISSGAEEVLKKAEANTLLGSAMVKKLESEGKTLEDILNSSRDVLEDLKDD